MFVWRYLLFGCVLLVALAEAQKRNYSSFPCPKYCVCFRKTVRCMQLNFVQIPKVPFHTVLLDVRFNKISEIFPGTFKGHKNLRSLLLNDNLLTSLKNGVFTGLINLRHLYLYKNRIRYIESDVFQNLPKLEHLYLHSNALEEIKPGTFTNLPSLDRLFLYNNKIQRIPYGAIGHMQKLTRLRLDSNALVCDCGLAWLSKMLKDNNLHTAAHCRDPQEMYGKSLMSMEKSDFHCKSLEISEGPSDVEVTWGTEAVFTCRAEGDPQPTVVWMRDEQVLEYDGEKYSITDDGSLMIKNTDERDSGKYECMAKNADGEVKSRPARMVVKKYGNKDGNLKFITKPRTVTTTVGSEVRLECEATGNPKPIITWSRNGIILSLTTRHLLESNGNLIIRPIQQDDYGTYRCDAHNAFGRISAEAEVVLNAAPVFTIHPESTNARPGETIKLECVAVGSPKPQITWYKEDSEIQKSDRVFISPDGSYLEIQNSKEDDSGTYVCEARNLIGYREVAAAVKVEALSFKPPKLLYKPYDVDALLGSTIELPCKADGNPTPGIQWRKDGSSLQRNGRTRVSITGNLYINGILPEDQGRYECSAQNEHGRDTASGFIRVKQDPHNSGIGIGDKFVKVAFVEASDEVDKAINKTIMNLFHSRGPHNSADLFRLIRYPNAPARELARAAEVYERTLVNIRKHVARGMSMNSTEDFNYRELLSPEHLNLVATLSGCMAHRYKRNCTDICFHSKYRSIDGMCNNFQNPTWGASLTAFNRILKPIYENGFSTPIGWDKSVRYYGHPKPPSRLVSTTLITTERITPDSLITHMVMQWGQFLDHDLDHAIPSVSSESWDGIDCKKSCDYAAPCYPIDVPQGDPRIQNRRCIDFVRSSAICGSGMTSVFFDNIQPREQINQLTSFIDASQVYGFSEELSNNLRDLTDDKGHLRKGHQHPGRKPLLPFDGNQGMDCRRNLSESSVSCFLAGDIRVNEQVGLIAMHTLWFREHNRVADELRFLNPHWNGETVYQEARKIIGAAMQHITYKQWLPLIIGEEGMKMLGDYKSYDPSINPSILNVFATAALRFGHTLINPILHRLDENFETIKEGNLELHKAFFSPWRVFDEGGIDPLLRGLYAIPAKLKKPQENLNVELTEKLFKSAHAVALDLAAINIHRSRDHAIPGYIEFRKYCNMKEVDRFEDLRSEISDPEVIDKLKKLYGHPGNIDVWVGGVLEDVVEGGKVGPLFRCLLVDQFRRLRDGDRFWYENPSTFKPEQLAQIKQYSLARVLCDSADNITRVTKNVFLLPERQGGYVDCKEVPKVDLGLWTQCCDDCRFGGSFNSVNRFNGRNRRQIKKDATCASTEALEQRISYLEGIIHNMTKTIEKIISS